jgi:ABC-2 type transport system permease protein
VNQVAPPAARPEPGQPAPDQAATDGSAPGYRARHTLPLRVELSRQLHRRRTQVTLGLLAVLPLLLLVAFELGNQNPNRRSGAFVDLATTGGLNFVMFALFVSAGFLLVVVVALFFGDTVASEASWSSLKYLLAVPVPRGRLLRQKAVVAALLSLLAMAILPAVAFGVGLLRYGTADLISPTGESLPFGIGVLRGVLAVCYIALQLSWIAGIALLLSVSTDAPLGAVGGAVLVQILSQILDQITALGSLRNFLPTHYSYAFSDLLGTDVNWNNLANGVFSALAYATVFVLLAARRFATKDITS